MHSSMWFYVVGTADTVLIREVSLVQSVRNGEVPLYAIVWIGLINVGLQVLFTRYPTGWRDTVPFPTSSSSQPAMGGVQAGWL